MSAHEYTAGRKAVRGDTEGRACIICGNLSDECDSPILQAEPEGHVEFTTISGSPVSAPPPIKPRKPRRKKGQ
jgi:hypothetical protein